MLASNSTFSLHKYLKKQLLLWGALVVVVSFIGLSILVLINQFHFLLALCIVTVIVILFWSWAFYITNLFDKKISEPLLNIHTTLEEISGGASRNRISLVQDNGSLEELQLVAGSINRLADKVTKDILDMKRLERVRSEFLGNVSHELRTPIFAIQGFLETLLDGALEDEKVRKQFVERAFVNAERLSTLLTDLIDISRIESGEMKLSLRYVDLNEVIAEVTSTLIGLAESTNITLSISSNSTQLRALVDKERFSQVLTNLIENAIKYNNSNGTVTISAFPENGSAIVTITDNGIGITEEHIDRIFERFYRVDKDRSRSVGGSGLGLAIVKHIIEAHKATIHVTSKLGEGTSFKISLRQ